MVLAHGQDDKGLFELHASICRTLAHPKRLEILSLLRQGELSVGELQATVQTTNGNISQHLAILRNQGIIACRREANFIYNRIADERILSLMRCMQFPFCNRGGQDGDPV